ncbi:hypothetical protein D3C72_2197310 [compost metagenome]
MLAEHLADEQKAALFVNAGGHGEESGYRKRERIGGFGDLHRQMIDNLKRVRRRIRAVIRKNAVLHATPRRFEIVLKCVWPSSDAA